MQILKPTLPFPTCSEASVGTYGRAIWIDYNQNGIFYDPGEQVASSTSYAPSPLVGTFVIPATALPGPTRMRILATWIPSNPSDACNNPGKGEYEDYTIVISPGCPPPNPITASAITYNSASIGWTAIPSASGYEYVVNTSLSAPTGADTATTAISVNVGSLNATTQYYVHVRTNCGSGSFSQWVVDSFTTALQPCDTPIALTVSNITIYKCGP